MPFRELASEFAAAAEAAETMMDTTTAGDASNFRLAVEESATLLTVIEDADTLRLVARPARKAA